MLELASTIHVLHFRLLTGFFLFKDVLSDRFEFSHRTLGIVDVEFGASMQFVAGYIRELEAARSADDLFLGKLFNLSLFHSTK